MGIRSKWTLHNLQRDALQHYMETINKQYHDALKHDITAHGTEQVRAFQNTLPYNLEIQVEHPSVNTQRVTAIVESTFLSAASTIIAFLSDMDQADIIARPVPDASDWMMSHSKNTVWDEYLDSMKTSNCPVAVLEDPSKRTVLCHDCPFDDMRFKDDNEWSAFCPMAAGVLYKSPERRKTRREFLEEINKKELKKAEDRKIRICCNTCQKYHEDCKRCVDKNITIEDAKESMCNNWQLSFQATPKVRAGK